MNNSLINMSDYQKIIFVKDLDENTLGFNAIKNISEKYPFALFLTTNTSEVHASSIWNAGQRLTRFIDVDPNHNKINVGGHTLRLIFDYETGKIGIYDDNSLKSIEIKKISWTDIDNTIKAVTYEAFTSTSTPIVDSINNKFTITYRFSVDDDDSSNAENVSNSLKIYGNNNNIVTTDYSLDNVIVAEKNYLPESIDYAYTYQINRDTIVANEPGSYKAVSEYSSNVECSYIMKMYLNPTKYNIIASIEGTNDTVSLGQNSNFRKGDIINLTFNFEPSNINSYTRNNDFRHMYVQIISSDKTVIALDPNGESDRNYTGLIYNGYVNARLYVSNDVEVNTTKVVELTFKVCFKKNDEIENEFKYLEKKCNVVINGDSTENFIYYGYEDPTDPSFSKSKLISFANKIPGTDVLYDWETDTVITDFDNSKYKYIAIPYKYVDSIKPRLDLYTVDRIKGNMYVDNSYAFDIIAKNKEIANTGIEFIVYRSKKDLHSSNLNNTSKNAFYFGKIQ